MTVRTTFDRYDRRGTRLEVTTEDSGEIAFTIGPLTHFYCLDADAAVRLAHDLLERAACDDPEVVAARAALRVREEDLPSLDALTARDWQQLT